LGKNWILLIIPIYARVSDTALVISINTIAGGRSSERNLMDDFLQGKTSVNSTVSTVLSNLCECFGK
jgi:hypothetical protein